MMFVIDVDVPKAILLKTPTLSQTSHATFAKKLRYLACFSLSDRLHWSNQDVKEIEIQKQKQMITLIHILEVDNNFIRFVCRRQFLRFLVLEI